MRHQPPETSGERLRRTLGAHRPIECLDWILIFNQNHLQKVMKSYVAHYNGGRPHRGLHLNIPAAPAASSRDGDTDGGAGAAIERTDILGGLIHEYRRAA